ncbi:P-loop containing nucleoside triphosphate hydrolase protein [Neurospora crassa]|uniref:P-loop containing nucleoside triphosphate hydrolase protein n=1 Tax=Neurospora crassa (strain ATCC 24698 / 74-OR23-1A / CBS 708.71 / DSM 1257 / FGSC 987) TaxID=367110 RepID=V5IKK5_NEUCR|nr:hypothetical protein NCU12069 [Neurospora crassa OR74A]ESA42098.1 hypothetical protein NCU12069 [Neurospora crassa OR74A]KHE86819.1 P-loop containing nucleoside triphosphate hydrolase protein [Neurospora crassa]|eukprot:XP_011395035.1 hypothetical protein NCU12069 [Neurospora crassa OR74A]
MSEPYQPRQFGENVRRLRDDIRRIGRELLPPEDLVPDYTKELSMREPIQVTIPARTPSPLQPALQPVPQSSPPGGSKEQNAEEISTKDEEKDQRRKSNGSQHEILTAIQQRINHLEEQNSWPVAPRQTQEITSFKDALEVPLQVVGSKATDVGSSATTTLMQHFYDHMIIAYKNSRADIEAFFTANPDVIFEKFQSMSVEDRWRAFPMIQAYVSKASILRTATKTTNPRHKPRFFAVLGGPGSGKSTICATWAKLDGGVMHIAVGDILRSEAKRPDSPYAEVLKANLAKGAIGDPEMTVGLIKDYIRTRIRSATGPIHTYLLDGFPRAVASAQYFERTVGPISKVIVLDIPEATLIDRCLQRNRSDDNHDPVRERIRVYNTKSAEVIADYALRGKVSLLSEPSDWQIRTWAGYWIMNLNHTLFYSVDVGKDVILRAVACGLLIWELCVIRDDCTELNAR